MKNITIINTGDDLIEGAFDEEGTLIGYWSPNDAYWSDYFDPMLKRLGINVTYKHNDELDLKLRRIAVEAWGIDEEEAGIYPD